jgi:hypothetical protein
MTEKIAQTYNKSIAASRAGRRNLRLQLPISSGFGRTNAFGLLFVIFYFYIFIQQRLWADTAMNSLPAAMLECYLLCYNHKTIFSLQLKTTKTNALTYQFLSLV